MREAFWRRLFEKGEDSIAERRVIGSRLPGTGTVNETG
jgi:hypothetical protein